MNQPRKNILVQYVWECLGSVFLVYIHPYSIQFGFWEKIIVEKVCLTQTDDSDLISIRLASLFSLVCANEYLDVCDFSCTGLHVTLDSLLLDNDLKNLVKDMVINSGRLYPVEKNNGTGFAAASEKQAEKVQEGIATIQINGSSSNRSSIPVWFNSFSLSLFSLKESYESTRIINLRS